MIVIPITDGHIDVPLIGLCAAGWVDREQFVAEAIDAFIVPDLPLHQATHVWAKWVPTDNETGTLFTLSHVGADLVAEGFEQYTYIRIQP